MRPVIAPMAAVSLQRVNPLFRSASMIVPAWSVTDSMLCSSHTGLNSFPS